MPPRERRLADAACHLEKALAALTDRDGGPEAKLAADISYLRNRALDLFARETEKAA